MFTASTCKILAEGTTCKRQPVTLVHHVHDPGGPGRGKQSTLAGKTSPEGTTCKCPPVTFVHHVHAPPDRGRRAGR